jgi:WD40 repeat protein
MNRRFTTICMALAVGSGLVTAQTTSAQAERLLESARHKEVIDGDLKGAMEQYRRIASQFKSQPEIAARALYQLGQCQEKSGEAEARKSYEHIVREYRGAAQYVNAARARLAALGAGSRTSPDVQARLLWDRAADTGGTVSADGRLLSFTDWSTGDLAVRDLVTGQSRRVTNKGGYVKAEAEAEESAISPDGKLIAFTWNRWDSAAAKEGRFQLRLIDTEGRNEKVLLGGERLRAVWPQCWSPDGKWIAAAVTSVDRPGSTIMLFSADKAEPRTVLSLPDRDPRKMSFSPDGKWLAYSTDVQPGTLTAESRRNAYTVSTEGSANAGTQIAADAEIAGWTPDGSGLLFTRSRNEVSELYLLPVSNGRATAEARRLHNVPEVGGALGVTSQGALMYAKWKRMTEAVFSPVNTTTATRGSESVAPLASFGLGGMSWGVRFSPDGRKILSTPTPKTILIRSLPDGAEHTIVPQLARVGRIEWTADSDALLVAGASSDGKDGVYRVDPRSGAATLLFAEPSVWVMAPSPSGTTLYYRKHRAAVVARDLKTGVERTLFNPPDMSFNDLRVSRDGRKIALLSLRRFHVLDVASGTVQLRYEHSEEAFNKFWGGDWSADGKHFLTIASFGPINSRCELWSIPVEGGEPARQPLSSTFRGVWLSPDGKQLAMMRWENFGQVWALEHFLPTSNASAR